MFVIGIQEDRRSLERLMTYDSTNALKNEDNGETIAVIQKKTYRMLIVSQLPKQNI